MLGQIVKFGVPIANFNHLTNAEAKDILYNNLVPKCEEKGVLLSQYGNHNVAGAHENVDKYNEKKANEKLFDVDKVQEVFGALRHLVVQTAQYKSSSYGLKHSIEEKLDPADPYATNGDVIAAMLLAGHEARFGKRTEQMTVNCDFKAKFVG